MGRKKKKVQGCMRHERRMGLLGTKWVRARRTEEGRVGGDQQKQNLYENSVTSISVCNVNRKKTHRRLI